MSKLIDRTRALLAIPAAEGMPWRRDDAFVEGSDGERVAMTSGGKCRSLNNAAFIVQSANDAISLARLAVAVAEASPGLRREHGGFEGDNGWMTCPKNYNPPVDECRCAEPGEIDEHNAMLDRLRAMLEAEG